MTKINHFQTYSQRENHVTNNTMLMLRHVYRTSPWLLENVLQALLESEEVEIGPRFEQQAGASHSTPDAVLSQKPLYIYVEAKRDGTLGDEQLGRHLRSIKKKKHPDSSAFLIGLTSKSASIHNIERWNNMAAQYRVSFAAATYGELAGALEKVCSHDADLQDIYRDYQEFISSENLLPDQYRKLVALLCGQSWRENVDFGAYFEPAERSPKWTRASFIGIYRLKKITYVGRMVAAAVCRLDGDKLVVVNEELGSLDDDMKDRITKIISAATYYPGFATEPHRYYLVDKFLPTDISKTSLGGMMGHRYFDIETLSGVAQLDQNIASSEVADLLNGKTFE